MTRRMIYQDGGVQIRDLGNEPRGGILSRHVLRMEYHHVEEGGDRARFHDFRPGVVARVLPGRQAVLLYREDGRPLADDF